jgi:tetratricopeptide (TPR) repeat protein
MKNIILFVMVMFTAIITEAQSEDSTKRIVISDKGDHMEMKIGDTTFSISFESLYNDYVQKGVNKANEGDFSGAITDFNLALLYKTNDPYAFYNRGLSYQSLKEFEKAIDDYNITISLDSTFAQAYSQRGIALSMLQKYQEALPDFLKSVKLKPEEAMYHYNTGIIYLQIGEYGEACNFLYKAKEMGYQKAESLITQYCD